MKRVSDSRGRKKGKKICISLIFSLTFVLLDSKIRIPDGYWRGLVARVKLAEKSRGVASFERKKEGSLPSRSLRATLYTLGTWARSCVLGADRVSQIRQWRKLGARSGNAWAAGGGGAFREAPANVLRGTILKLKR